MKILQLYLLYCLGSCLAEDHGDIDLRGYPTHLTEPLLLTPNYELLMPSHRGRITLSENEGVILSCPGPGNELLLKENTISNPTEVRCSPQRGSCKLSMHHANRRKQSFNIKQFFCLKETMGWTLLKNSTCGPTGWNGTIVQLTFQVKGHFIPLIESCLSIPTGTTFYSVHAIQGSRLANRVNTRKRWSYVTGDGRLFNPSRFYKMKSQLEILPEVVKSKKDYLIRGQLAPPGDFALLPHQSMAYFYANTAPQWKSTNACWRIMEHKIQRVAIEKRLELEVVTGTSGLLKLERSAIMLGKTSLPVPEVFWKIVKNRSNCTGFVISNNPLVHATPPLCNDTCTETGWQDLLILNKSHVYCCSYLEMKAAIPEVPEINCACDLKI